jgi:hypothetical protein
MAKARRDGKHLVYIGFGSITVPDPKGMTRTIVKAVLKSKLIFSDIYESCFLISLRQATSELSYLKVGVPG